jgi:hypothetical protein
LRLVPRHFVPLIIQAEVFAQRRAARDQTSGADFRAWRVGLSLCPVLWEQADRSLGACVGQRVGWLRVTGYGFDHDSREGRLTYAVTLGVDAAQRLLGPLSLRAYLGAEAPVVRDRFDSSGGNATELFRPASVGLAASIGLEVAAW